MTAFVHVFTGIMMYRMAAVVDVDAVVIDVDAVVIALAVSPVG